MQKSKHESAEWIRSGCIKKTARGTQYLKHREV